MQTKFNLDDQAIARIFSFGGTAANQEALLTLNNGTAATTNVVLNALGSINLIGEVRVGSTTVIDASRNATFNTVTSPDPLTQCVNFGYSNTLPTSGNQTNIFGSQNTAASAGYNQTLIGIRNSTTYSGSGSSNTTLVGSDNLAASGSISIGSDNQVLGSYSIGIGAGVRNTTANQLMIGGSTNYQYFAISSVVIGNGDTNTVPVGFNLRTTSGSGTNVAGASISISAGAGTGSASGGDIVFYTTPAGSSGSALNNGFERLRISSDGSVGMNGAIAASDIKINQFHISDGFTQLTSASSSLHLPFVYARSESNFAGLYFSVQKATNQSSLTGYGAAAFYFVPWTTLTAGYLFGVDNTQGDSSLLLDTNGLLRTRGGYSVAGTTVIDASRNAFFASSVSFNNGTYAADLSVVSGVLRASGSYGFRASYLGSPGLYISLNPFDGTGQEIATPNRLNFLVPNGVTFSADITTNGITSSARQNNLGYSGIYLNIGQSGGGYPALGYNVLYQTTNNTYNYRGADTALLLSIGGGTGSQFVFKTAPTGTANAAVTFTDRFYVDTNGIQIVTGSLRMPGNNTIVDASLNATFASANITSGNLTVGSNASIQNSGVGSLYSLTTNSTVKAGTSTNGAVTMQAGDSTHTGYLEWIAGTTGTRTAYMGYSGTTYLELNLSGYLHITGGNVNISSNALQISSTTVIDSSRNAFLSAYAILGGDISVDGTQGIDFQAARNAYYIKRTAGSWSAPNYQQLEINFPTGIILDGGSSYGKSYVDVRSDLNITNSKTLKVAGTTVIDASRNAAVGTLSTTGIDSSGYTRITGLSNIATSNIMGLELFMNSGNGYINVYNRGASTFANLTLQATSITLANSGGATVILDSSGNLNIGSGGLIVATQTVINSSGKGHFNSLDTYGSGTQILGSWYDLGSFSETSSGNAKGISLGYDSSAQKGIIGARSSGPNSSIAFWTYNSGWDERFTMAANGNFTAVGNLIGASYYVGATQVIDTSRNASFSSITASGASAFLNGDDQNGGGGVYQIAFGYSGSTQYKNYIASRHNAGVITNNAIDFYTSDGTTTGTLSTAKFGMTVNGGNVGIGTKTQFGGGVGVIGLADAATVPTAAPAGGISIYSESGVLKYRSSSGTIYSLTGGAIYTASLPISINGSNVISITQAGTSTNGYLSSTDWNTFNNKQSSGLALLIANNLSDLNNAATAATNLGLGTGSNVAFTSVKSGGAAGVTTFHDGTFSRLAYNMTTAGASGITGYGGTWKFDPVTGLLSYYSTDSQTAGGTYTTTFRFSVSRLGVVTCGDISGGNTTLGTLSAAATTFNGNVSLSGTYTLTLGGTLTGAASTFSSYVNAALFRIGGSDVIDSSRAGLFYNVYVDSASSATTTVLAFRPGGSLLHRIAVATSGSTFLTGAVANDIIHQYGNRYLWTTTTTTPAVDMMLEAGKLTVYGALTVTGTLIQNTPTSAPTIASNNTSAPYYDSTTGAWIIAGKDNSGASYTARVPVNHAIPLTITSNNIEINLAGPELQYCIINGNATLVNPTTTILWEMQKYTLRIWNNSTGNATLTLGTKFKLDPNLVLPTITAGGTIYLTMFWDTANNYIDIVAVSGVI